MAAPLKSSAPAPRKSRARTVVGRMARTLLDYGVADRDVYVAAGVLLAAGFTRKELRHGLRDAQELARIYARRAARGTFIHHALGAPATGGPRRAAPAARPVEGRGRSGRPILRHLERSHVDA